MENNTAARERAWSEAILTKTPLYAHPLEYRQRETAAVQAEIMLSAMRVLGPWPEKASGFVRDLFCGPVDCPPMEAEVGQEPIWLARNREASDRLSLYATGEQLTQLREHDNCLALMAGRHARAIAALRPWIGEAE